jgi:outer membrane lipoprotein-sorting protein
VSLAPLTMLVNAKFSRVATRGFLGLAAIGFFLIFAAPVDAASQQGYRLNNVQKAHVSRIRAYLNRITTMQARFIQTNPDGAIWEGTLSIRRPGKFRFEYDPPVPHTLISNGTWFIHVDRELQESNFLPLDRTPAQFLLSEHVSFDKDVTLIGFRQKAGLIHLKILNKDNPDLGHVTLTFNERPLALRQWRVQDAQNKNTLITLQNTRLGLKLESDLFKFVEPDTENVDQ